MYVPVGAVQRWVYDVGNNSPYTHMGFTLYSYALLLHLVIERLSQVPKPCHSYITIDKILCYFLVDPPIGIVSVHPHSEPK